MKIKSKYLIFVLLLSFISSCSTYRELKYLAKCDFELASIKNISLSGVNLVNKTSIKDLKFSELKTLKEAFKEAQMYLSFTANIRAINPNKKTAAINKIDYIVYLEEIEMVGGSVPKRVEIAPLDEAIIPIDIDIDLKKVFKKESMTAIVNFVLNLSKKGNAPSNMKFKIKPTIMFGKHEITYGKFITVKTQISSENE